MRLLITVLFLVSFGSVSMADIGDVYYCEMKNIVSINSKHELKSFIPEKFKLIWESDKKIKFGLEKGFFKDSVFVIYRSFDLAEAFYGGSDDVRIKFVNGEFYFAFVGIKVINELGYFNNELKILAMTATCSKF